MESPNKLGGILSVMPQQNSVNHVGGLLGAATANPNLARQGQFSRVRGLLGNSLRQPYQSELTYFHNNPNVTGMAAEDNKVILNPFSNLNDIERMSVANNELARIFMRGGNSPSFGITDAQRTSFRGSPYEGNDAAIGETLAARLFAGDPSAGIPTNDQLNYVRWLTEQMRNK